MTCFKDAEPPDVYFAEDIGPFPARKDDGQKGSTWEKDQATEEKLPEMVQLLRGCQTKTIPIIRTLR